MPTSPRVAKPRPVARKPAKKKAPRKATPAASLTASVRALERVAESLHFTRESFGESMLRLPRAEDHEPLTEPLGRLAGAVPALLQALGATQATPKPPLDAAVRDAVASARLRLAEALARLPRAEDYEPMARKLRELASVSPSLLDWLGEVPPLAAPLVASVADLREALLELDHALELLGPDEGPGAKGTPTATARVKVIVRGSPHPAYSLLPPLAQRTTIASARREINAPWSRTGARRPHGDAVI